jgi:neopullulanase
MEAKRRDCRIQMVTYMSPIKTILFCIALTLHTLAYAQIKRVEPLNWWTGMKNPELQLMVNGDGVGETMPFIQYAGVTIKTVTPGDSKNYLFIDLLIDRKAKHGSFNIDFRKGGKTLFTYQYTLLPRIHKAEDIKGFNSSDVIYLVVPDRFANGDSTNDVVQGMPDNQINRKGDRNRHGGDIKGITDHLDYLSQMGFTAIWPTPMLENNMPQTSYHGYAITDHYKVDPRYGSLDAYKDLAQKARQKGMKLIFDEVLNHTGSRYWWMDDLPFKNWINLPDSFQQSNHRRTINQDKYASAYDKNLMTNGWFARTMPDMNGKNKFLANYLIQSSIWWIETLELGGIRQDTYGYSDKDLLTSWSCRIMDEYPNFSLVGEEWSLNPLITSYWQQGKKNADGYVSCLTTAMDFPLQNALITALKTTEATDINNKLTSMYEALANDFVYPDPKNILIFGDNHDMDRLFTQLDDDADLTKMALTYLSTIRGIPQILYGTEILMTNTGHHKVDGLIRSDFPGGWNHDRTNAFTGSGLTTQQKEMQNYLKQLLNWRKNNSVIATGETLHFAPFDGIYVYFRYNKEKTVMVIMNKNATPRNIDLKRFAEILKSKTSAKNVISNERHLLNVPLGVDAKTALVFEVE